MDSPDYSSDNFGSSEEDIKGVKASGRPMTLRGRQRKSYIELEARDDDDSDDLGEEDENPKKIPQNIEIEGNDEQENEEIFNEDPSGTNQEDAYEEPYTGIFNPEIDQILWKREKIVGEQRKVEYLVKYKEYSYLHCQWFDEEQILSIGKNIKNKLNRFNKTFEKKLQDFEEYETANQEGKFFDPSFIEVDRIIYCTELFPVLHPKKGNELKGKWSEYLGQTISILLNFTKNNIHYGVYFMDPVDPERDNAPNYRKVITNPMDLGTLLNRVYLDYYKTPSQFWIDLGFVFKNCRKFNKDPGSDIRVLCDTLREAAIELYKQWYVYMNDKYQRLMNEFKEKKRTQVNTPQQNVDEKEDHKKRQIEMEFKSKENEVQNILSRFETFQNNTFMNPTNNPSQLQFQLNQFINTNPLLFNSKISLDEVSKTIQDKASIEELNKLQNKQSVMPISMPKSNANPINDQNLKRQELTNIITTKFEQTMSLPEVELWNPGEYNFKWLLDEKATINIEDEERYYFTDEEIKDLDLMKEVDKLYFVKWKNLSYTDSTWELESIIANPAKINDFRFFNRALDKESRQALLNQVNRHKTYMEILNNPKKKAKCSSSFINDLKNKLYFYDVAMYREPIQYTFKNQPIFKDQKLLRDYQLESLNWLIQSWYHKRSVILADEMGLGKTVQSIAFLNHLNNFEGCRGPFLVIAPLSTLEHWKRTGEIWTNLNSILYYDTNSIEGRTACRGYEWFYIDVSTKGTLLQTAELYKFQILITSYEVFLQDLNTVFLQIPFQYIVVDEAHRLKNTNAKILTSLKRLACKRILLLTGTPIQNNTEELWSLLNYIEPEKFYSLQAFMADFGDLSNAEQVEKLHKMVRPYLLRRKKEEVEHSIPPLQETIIDVEMTTVQKTIYRALYEKNKSVLSKGVINTNFATSLNNLEMQLRKCCNHPFLIKEIEAELTKECVYNEEKMQKLVESSGKMILLDKLLPKMKNEGKKVLIFSQFTQMLSLLEEYLRNRGYRYEKIDGAVKSKERQNAIDRFNDPTKKRDVFLLSTKAGGLGINLTSANVVVIFDSDWNPQNDVQATARAHRIGQQSEVMVYRLITAKTYESEMFERASKKLGLDQAIFMGGDWKATKDDGKAKDKMNKSEVETLLKKGILGLINDENKESQRFMEQDIEDILANNTKVAKVSMLSGSYTFQKSSFVSEKTDANLSVDDPNFWNIVLKNQESIPKQLLEELESSKDINKSYEEQKIFMLKLSDSVYKVIENKLNVEGYNADDEKNVMDILNRICTSKQFHKTYRDFALQWSYEIARPNRRIKKVLAHELEIAKASTKSESSRTRAKKGEAAGSDEEQVFNEEGEEEVGGEEEFLKDFEEEEDEGLANKKISNKMKDELLRKLCNYCERTKCTFFCQGYCKRNFHEICKDKVDQGVITGLDKNVINYDVAETKTEEEKLKKNMNLDYICNDCQKNVAMCFKCKKKGKFYPELSSSKSKSKAKNTADKDESLASENGDEKTESESIASTKPDASGRFNELIKCSTANCNKFYHLSCISDNPLFKFFDANKHKKFRCALHYCAKCKISGDTMAIAQCFRCPKAYHLKCYAKDKILKITKKVIICQDHEFEMKNPPKEKEKEKEKESSGSEKKKGKDKNGTQLKIEKGSDNSMVIKMSKIDEKGGEKDPNEEDFDDFKIPKNKKALKKKEKQEKKEKELEKKNERNIYLSFKVGDEVVVSEVVASIPNKLKRKLDLGEYQKPKKNTTREKLTYEELKIDAPEDFDYENYDRDWCRYCGARYSSNFTKGPWGSRTLCTIHYIDWNQKKTLNLTNYKDLPKRPIKPEVNTELSFLQRLLSKNDQEFTPEILESLIPTKKVKRPQDNSDIASEELSKGEQRSAGEVESQDAMEEEKE